jgi:hypothetical protein
MVFRHLMEVVDQEHTVRVNITKKELSAHMKHQWTIIQKELGAERKVRSRELTSSCCYANDMKWMNGIRKSSREENKEI